MEQGLLFICEETRAHLSGLLTANNSEKWPKESAQGLIFLVYSAKTCKNTQDQLWLASSTELLCARHNARGSSDGEQQAKRKFQYGILGGMKSVKIHRSLEFFKRMKRLPDFV